MFVFCLLYDMYMYTYKQRRSNEFVSLVDDITPQSNRQVIHKHTMPGDGEAEHLRNLPRPPIRVSAVVAQAASEHRPSMVKKAQSKFMQTVRKSQTNEMNGSELELPIRTESVSQPGAETVQV